MIYAEDIYSMVLDALHSIESESSGGLAVIDESRFDVSCISSSVTMDMDGEPELSINVGIPCMDERPDIIVSFPYLKVYDRMFPEWLTQELQGKGMDSDA